MGCPSDFGSLMEFECHHHILALIHGYDQLIKQSWECHRHNAQHYWIPNSGKQAKTGILLSILLSASCDAAESGDRDWLELLLETRLATFHVRILTF